MDLDLYLYNTLGRRIERFTPLRPPKVHLYACGPTVYGDSHIGNMRTFVFSDVVRRVLEFAGYDVIDAMNITDVGHLTSNADEGEDKLAVTAAEQRKTAWEVADHYTKVFFEFSDVLNILPKHHIVRATDHIPEQIALISRLEEAGVIYQTADGLYFDTTKISDYGKLTPTDDRSDQLAGTRVAVGDKRNPTDFAVWKFSPEDGAKRDMEWPSPWGAGFPGWHIECSAMAMKYLGETLDIHIGGIDHIPIHHTNEIAQSETATGKPFARFWLHGAFLELGEERMGKSEGNAITIRTLQDEGYDPLAFRYLVLLSHYRKPLDFSEDGLDAAATAYARLRQRMRDFAAAAGEEPPLLSDAGHGHRDCFVAALADDLNTPKAVACVWQVARATDIDDAEKYALLVEFDQVLGLDLDAPEAQEDPAPAAISALAEERETHRSNKDFDEADRLRDEIAAAGYEVIDTADGYRLRRLERGPDPGRSRTGRAERPR